MKEKQYEAINSIYEGRSCSRGCLRGTENRCATNLLFRFDFKLGRTRAIATERSVALVVFPLVSLMVDQVYSLQAHGVCAAIRNNGNTGVSKALLATERDIAQGKLRFLFTAPGAIVGNSRWKQIFLSYQIVAVTVLCIQMCPHTLSAHSLRERLHHCQIFYGVLYGK